MSPQAGFARLNFKYISDYVIIAYRKIIVKRLLKNEENY